MVATGGDDSKPELGRDPHRDLAGVLHDVSNALTVLLGWVSETRSPEATPESIAYSLTIIEQRARIARDLARHAIGSPRIDEPCAAGDAAREIAASLRLEASRAGTSIRVLAAPEPGPALAGALDVSQVLTNLVLNAIAFAPEGSTVDLEVISEDDRCSIVVTDRGPGVPPEKREAIFAGASRRPGGTGIGLRHSRALARACGGDVELLPPSSGAGARFRMTWPRIDAVPRPPTSTARVRGLAGMHILLVEDDVAVTQLLETALEARGAEVTIAASQSELDAAMDVRSFHAALVDLSPIATDPSGALARLRRSSPGIELVLITGSADRLPGSVATEEMKLVRKPFELGEVLAVLLEVSKKP